MRGHFGIGIYHPKCSTNMGTLWRSAMIYDADYIFTIGRRYQKQASDTLKTWRHMPLWNFATFEDFCAHMPYGARLVCVELAEGSQDLRAYKHHQRAVYLLGAEDHGIPPIIMEGYEILTIPSPEPFCLNVATAGTLVLYDRYVKGD